ncbi:MAG: hypothetical protein ACI9WO_001847 [Sphingobacteriales bacterium]
MVTNGLTVAITGAHLPRAPSGTAGGVVTNLSTLISGTKITGSMAVPAELKDSLEILVKTGQIYLNLHTAANAGGEVRGQALASQDLYFDGGITTGQVAAPIMTASSGFGAGHGYINRSFDEYRYLFIIEADSLTGTITEAGLYVGALGAAGVLVKTLTVTGGNRIGGKWSKSDATQPLTDDNINSFLYGDVYIKISTAANPSGEIRGQLTRAAREGYLFELNTDQEVPAPTVTKVPNGGGMVSINAARTSAHYMVAWDSLSGPVASAHFHKAVPGVAGGVIFVVPTNNNAAFGYWNAANGFTKENELMFRRDSVYLNIHTDANAGGEVRGNISRGYKISSETVVATAVNNVLSTNNPFQLYPNPVSFNATISMNVETAFEGTIIVTDLTGLQVQVLPFNVSTGDSKVSIETSTLTNGVYLLSINSSNGVIAASKFVKQ